MSMEQGAGGQSVAPQERTALEQEIQKSLAERDYAAVLESLAKMAEMRICSPDAFYAGAYAYFMQGDYERAGEWVNNTLTYEPSHVPARILLARLCILEDRTAEALTVLDVLLEAGAGNLREDDLEEIREIVSYYGRTKKEMVCRDYPHITAFLGLAQEKADSGEGSSFLPVVEKTSHPEKERNEGDALSVARAKVDEIVGMSCSVKEKLQLLSSFAGAWYFDDELPAAEILLKEALRMDPGNAEALKGLALVAAESGDKDKALQYAVHVQPTDFLFLRAIRDL